MATRTYNIAWYLDGVQEQSETFVYNTEFNKDTLALSFNNDGIYSNNDVLLYIDGLFSDQEHIYNASIDSKRSTVSYDEVNYTFVINAYTQEVQYLIGQNSLDAISNAIRGVNGETAKYSPATMATKISELSKPSGSISITENGTINVKNYETAEVNISGGLVEVTTASEMDTLLTSANLGKYYLYTGTTTSEYINGDIYQVESV